MRSGLAEGYYLTSLSLSLSALRQEIHTPSAPIEDVICILSVLYSEVQGRLACHQGKPSSPAAATLSASASQRLCKVSMSPGQ